MLHEIGGRAVGAGEPVFTIAEIGLNHGGSVDRALAMVDAAAAAGVSAIKLQTLSAERLVAESCPAPAHVSASSGPPCRHSVSCKSSRHTSLSLTASWSL